MEIMIDNYSIDQHGVIHQIDRKPFDYSKSYIDGYRKEDETYKRKALILYAMRYGFVVANNAGRIPESILDIGYGSGGFLDICVESGCNAYGYDIAKSEEKKSFSVIDNFDGIFTRHFDVVTFFDSLEHMEDIYWLHRLDCDFVCISVPWCRWERIKEEQSESNADSWFENWKHRKPDEHLHHFSGGALIHYMADMGYTAVSSMSHIEDSIRKPEETEHNILTMIFKRKSGDKK